MTFQEVGKGLQGVFSLIEQRLGDGDAVTRPPRPHTQGPRLRPSGALPSLSVPPHSVLTGRGVGGRRKALEAGPTADGGVALAVPAALPRDDRACCAGRPFPLSV